MFLRGINRARRGDAVGPLGPRGHGARAWAMAEPWDGRAFAHPTALFPFSAEPLAALHGEEQGRRSGIAAHHIYVEPEHLLRDQGKDEVARRSISGPERYRHAWAFEIRDGSRRVRRVDEHQIRIVRVGRKAAEPGELRRVELCVRMAFDRELRDGALELGQHRAVPLRVEIEPVGGDQAARTGIALHDYGWAARNETGQMSRHQARRDIVDPAGGSTHQHDQGVAFIELLDRLRARRVSEQQREQQPACGDHAQVSRAQCSMNSACTFYSIYAHRDCAAHDALQNRERTKLWRFPARRLWWSRISGAPLRALTSGSYETAGVCARAAPRPGHATHGSAASRWPKPCRGSRTCRRFWISQTRAVTGCTTGTCKSRSSVSMISRVRQPDPSM